MLRFTQRPKTPGITSEKTWLFVNGIIYLQVIFVLIWMNKRWYGSIYKEKDLEMDCLASRILLQNACSYKFQFCTKICASRLYVSSRLVSPNESYECWAKYKEKVPYVSDPNQNIDTKCYSKLKFTKLKDLFIKRVQKN